MGVIGGNHANGDGMARWAGPTEGIVAMPLTEGRSVGTVIGIGWHVGLLDRRKVSVGERRKSFGPAEEHGGQRVARRQYGRQSIRSSLCICRLWPRRGRPGCRGTRII